MRQVWGIATDECVDDVPEVGVQVEVVEIGLRLDVDLQQLGDDIAVIFEFDLTLDAWNSASGTWRKKFLLNMWPLKRTYWMAL